MFDLKNLQRKPDSRSCLSAPKGWRNDSDRTSPVFPLPPEDLWVIWTQVTAHSKRIVESKLDPETMQSFHVQLTPTLRFPDEVRAEIVGLPDGSSSIAVYSQSRYGLYDFGVNRKRLDRWLERLDRRVMAYRRFQKRQKPALEEA
jgi:hypothetical protein